MLYTVDHNSAPTQKTNDGRPVTNDSWQGGGGEGEEEERVYN